MINRENNPAGWRDWITNREKHRSRIKQIYASTSVRIDNHAPSYIRSSPRSKLSSGVYGSTLNLREIDRKNAQILEKLTRMAKSPVILKTLPIAANRVNKRKYFLKKLENNKIHQENVQFARRLAKTSSAVNFRKYESDFINNKKYCEIRQKHK